MPFPFILESQKDSLTLSLPPLFSQPVNLYLVKWCSLPYEDSTWELKADIDLAKIEEYEAVAARQPETKRVVSIKTSTHTLPLYRLSCYLFLTFFYGPGSLTRSQQGHAPAVARKPLTAGFYLKQERPPTDGWQKSESSRDYKNDNALREYQLEGVNWLLFNWYNT